ncbi:MAG: helix-turn-helix transcriptional regulator [Oscillospiraceae bacterium]|nr:helix-turn-helix transcriptional regulator [Oscillospiraceae bacterium]
MGTTYKKYPNARGLIVQEAARMFIEEGYTKSSINRLSKNLEMSPGHITFYFPTKEHLLAVLVEEMIAYQRITMEQETQEGTSSLLAYCLELTAIAAVCEESEIARDFYASAYGTALTLDRIRANDAEKTRSIFIPFHPEWTEEQWVAIENIVSGIEYGTIMTREEKTPLEVQIELTLNTILYLFGVPEDIRRAKIEKVLAMDYRALGHKLLLGFPEYVAKVNKEGLRPRRRMVIYVDDI